MTNDELRNTGLAMIAHADGKTVEFKGYNDEWHSVENPSWCDGTIYRPRSETISRPWTAADVPSLCWLRIEGILLNVLVTGVSEFSMFTRTETFSFSDTDKMRLLEYSTDRVTWKACTVTEP